MLRTLSHLSNLIYIYHSGFHWYTWRIIKEIVLATPRNAWGLHFGIWKSSTWAGNSVTGKLSVVLDIWQTLLATPYRNTTAARSQRTRGTWNLVVKVVQATLLHSNSSDERPRHKSCSSSEVPTWVTRRMRRVTTSQSSVQMNFFEERVDIAGSIAVSRFNDAACSLLSWISLHPASAGISWDSIAYLQI